MVGRLPKKFRGGPGTEISVQQSDQVMTEKGYYLWSNKFNNW